MHLHRRSTHQTSFLDRIIIKLRAGTEIRLATQRAKDVTDVIIRLDALVERILPPFHDPLNDMNARQINVHDCRLKGALFRPEQVRRRRFLGVRPVEIRRRAHDDDPREIHEPVHGGTEQGLQRSIIFLCRGAVHSASVGHEVRVVSERSG